ncbi:MAG TPA: alpha-L-arabinofuranosidase C-terminal domain-containing protein [Gemmataceae bacterium]|nr:alpha-L-arabinofuranosidase C-terminal domain-containing protein [Gemmataceae bacterium]
MRTSARNVTLIVAVWAVLTATATWAAPARLEIDLGHPGHAIPAGFYGLMTEEINYSYDGGLFAELIRNRTFQDPPAGATGRDPQPAIGVVPPHWSVVGAATAATNRLEPVNAALPVNLRLTLSGGTGGVANNGYWGIPVRPATKYTATFYARGHDNFAGPVTASLLLDAGDQTVASAATAPVTGEWKKYTVTFTTPANAPTTAAARFVLAASGQGSVDFSLVSLFPPTYGDVPNGLRPDLMQLLAAMHPKFIRLPGGNYAEGSRFADRFAWKTMIGPADERPGHMGCWSYRSSDGFGLPEYLLWCKQLGAEPVLALFAGYVLNGDYAHPGSPEMALYTQEALDEIEYVMGPADSEWGKRRAADGFPEPFDLKYVEIGNEDFFDRSGSYEGRFAEMTKAIRAKYPQLKIIATTPVKSVKPDLVDDHIYASAATMQREFTRYDVGSGHPEGRKADGVKVFMGEWATQGGSPTPNLNSALADAVFAMGLERNSDDVVMQCYAPLFANVDAENPAQGHPRGWQWNTNLIGYDALHAFGSPSYHVLAMFGANRGDVTLPVTFDVPQVVPPADPHPHGRIGVGMYGTRNEYTDIVVTGSDGQKLTSGNLADEPTRWRFPQGRWEMSGGVMHPPGNAPQSWALAGDPSWTDYTVTLRARKLGGNEGFILLWHSADGDNYRWWNLGGWGNTVSRCEVSESGGREPYGPTVPFTVETGRWYDLKLEVNGHTARGYVDGKLVMEATDNQHKPVPAAFASASYVNASGELIVKVVNTAATPLETAIRLKDAATVGAGTAIVLAGEPGAVNSIAQPDNVAPQVTPLTDAAASFTRTFAPQSVTLLRFPAKN